MSQSARNVAFLLALAAIVGVLAYGLSRRETGPRDLLASAPERAVLIGEVDVTALRASPLFLELVGQSEAGLDHIRDACGFDPLDQLRTAQIFVLRAEGNEDGEDGEALDEVAFLARGELDHEALAECVGEVAAGDGGGVHRTTIEGADAIASDHGASVAAFVGRDGVVAGTDVVVAELLRIQAGASPAMRRDDRLERLFRRAQRDGAGQRAQVRLVARLPRQWQRFLGRLGELAAEDVPLDRARALGLGASLAEGVSISLAIDLDSAEAASDAQHAIEQRITSARRDPELAASALAVTLAHLDVDAAGGDLVLRATLDRPELDATVALVRRYLAAERARDE